MSELPSDPMQASTVPLSYVGPQSSVCPLCRQRPTTSKFIYGHAVCKKCYYAFANRRQLGYLLDAVVWMIFLFGVGAAMGATMALMGRQPRDIALAGTILGRAMQFVFIMKDGFRGYSLGKLAAGIIVLDDETKQPIGFFQSFKRNSPLLVGIIPYAGTLVGLVVVIWIAVQVAKGYRLGDRFAGTKVIWKKYANSPVFGGDATECEKCGYELLGNTSGVCPECGTAVSPENLARLDMPVATNPTAAV